MRRRFMNDIEKQEYIVTFTGIRTGVLFVDNEVTADIVNGVAQWGTLHLIV